ncbi:MAG: hypothetical protein ACR2H3_04810 [Acidimicrobiales bacterium]
MSAHTRTPSPAVGAPLAELLMNAAAELADAPRTELVPIGIPVRGGLTLGRLRELLCRDETLEVVAGFAAGCWIGPAGVRAPDLGRLTYRSRTGLDRRGRVMLDHRARTWLAVEDPNRFEVVAFPAEAGGILVMPVEDFARRWEVISR